MAATPGHMKNRPLLGMRSLQPNGSRGLPGHPLSHTTKRTLAGPRGAAAAPCFPLPTTER